MTLKEALAYVQEKLKSEDPEMPCFVLLAKDRLAPDTVGHWVVQCESMNAAQEVIPAEKIAEAERCSEEMREWQNNNAADVQFPD